MSGMTVKEGFIDTSIARVPATMLGTLDPLGLSRFSAQGERRKRHVESEKTAGRRYAQIAG
jgi:hypothetical protein